MESFRPVEPNAALENAKKWPVFSHQVAFPRNPYGVQLVFMQKLIEAIHNKQNALLEAPTGCGKTLALLCGALAWQTKFKAVRAEDEQADALAYADIAMPGGMLTHACHVMDVAMVAVIGTIRRYCCLL